MIWFDIGEINRWNIVFGAASECIVTSAKANHVSDLTVLELDDWLIYDGGCPMALACTVLFMWYLYAVCIDTWCYVCMWYPLCYVMNEIKYHVMSCYGEVMWWIMWWWPCIKTCIYVICHWWKEKGNDGNIMLWMQIMGTLCMYICHVNRDTSPLFYGSMDTYLQYLCSPCYHAGLSFFCRNRWRVMRCARPSQA